MSGTVDLAAEAPATGPAPTPATGNFRRLVSASGGSNIADGAFVIALPLVALTLTREPTAIAAVTLGGRLPWLLFALPARAPRFRSRRRGA